MLILKFIFFYTSLLIHFFPHFIFTNLLLSFLFSEAADKVVKGDGKVEELVVCSQEIAASTTQLVVSSKVKVDKKSLNLKSLGDASKGVTEATGEVIATAKQAAQMIEEAGEFFVDKC